LAALRAYPPSDLRNLKGWIFKIAHNKAIDHHRARARAPQPAGEAERLDAGAAAVAPEWLGGRRAGMEDRHSTIWEAVGALPEGQRAAVILRFAVDLRYGEIGSALDISEEAARRRVADGLKKLRAAAAVAGEEAAA
jgi:RNA polymerase sigma factor (sigma-70 family)